MGSPHPASFIDFQFLLLVPSRLFDFLLNITKVIGREEILNRDSEPITYLLYCGYRSGVVASIHDIVQRRLGHSAHKAELIYIYIVLIAELYDPLPNSLSDSHGRHLFPAGKRLPNTACKV